MALNWEPTWAAPWRMHTQKRSDSFHESVLFGYAEARHSMFQYSWAKGHGASTVCGLVWDLYPLIQQSYWPCLYPTRRGQSIGIDHSDLAKVGGLCHQGCRLGGLFLQFIGSGWHRQGTSPFLVAGFSCTQDANKKAARTPKRTKCAGMMHGKGWI